MTCKKISRMLNGKKIDSPEKKISFFVAASSVIVNIFQREINYKKKKKNCTTTIHNGS